MKTMIALGGCALLLASCVPTTPQARIAQEPSLYHHLPARHQDLVSRGIIDKGMSPDAVYLAWGKASREYVGTSEKGKSTMRWDYAGSTPVYSDNIGGFYGGGYGYGRYGGYGRYYPYSAFSYGTEVTYVPYRRATVVFENQRVVSWERAR
ncbi:MAG: hypothetical protein JWO82_1945 [Akkermansiaceae bacterium]|nr:hypothetical protein [Akkermansiaceae bacterium]